MKIFIKYITYLFHYLKVTFFAFSANIFLYVLLKPNLGINLSAFISELSGTFVLFFILKLTKKSKIKKTIFGIFFQYLVSATTISINIISLNLINFLYLNYLSSNPIFLGLSEIYVSFLCKFTSSMIGLIFSSSMTIKFGFDFGKNK